MFFQSIYQMMSAGTDLNINIRRTDGKLSVAVMPRRTTLKDEAGQAIVPLILNGTPMELDGQFLQIITTPLQKAQGILTNLETFEQQARLTATQGKATGTANDKKTKEAREKQEKMEKLLKRAEEAFTAGKYSEATTCLRQAKVLADTDRQKQIEARIQEVQKECFLKRIHSRSHNSRPQTVRRTETGLTDKCGCSRHNLHNSLYSRQSRKRYNNRCLGRR